LAQFGLYGVFVLTTAMLAGILRMRAYWLALAGLLFVTGSMAPFLAQSRTPIILTVFSIFVFAYYYRKIALRHAVVGLVMVGLFTSAMGELRAINSYGTAGGAGFIDNTIGSGNGFDAVRSTAIMERVPEKAGHLYGSSYLAIPFFWVPRAVWPDKPNDGLGSWVKTTLFGVPARGGGWPPGFVAESYVNFGYIGILFIPFLIGLGMRALYDYFAPSLGRSYIATAVYVTFLYKLTFGVVATNLAHGITTGLLVMLPVAIMIRLSSRAVIRRPRPTFADTRESRAPVRPPGPHRPSSLASGTATLALPAAHSLKLP
jgi:oligosaccharide repeat unit polymerase